MKIPHVLARRERGRVYCACGWSWGPSGEFEGAPEELVRLQDRQLRRHVKESAR